MASHNRKQDYLLMRLMLFEKHLKDRFISRVLDPTIKKNCDNWSFIKKFNPAFMIMPYKWYEQYSVRILNFQKSKPNCSGTS